MKKILFAVTIFLCMLNVPVKANIKHYEVQVLDVVTKQPIQGVEIQFFFIDNCNTGMYLFDYDYATCNGEYEKIENKITDENGIINFSTFLGKARPSSFRYVIKKADGYLKNASYGKFPKSLACT